MKKIAGIGLALLTIAMLAAPVLAIGPDQAFEVGNNKNLVPFGPAVGNLRGNAGGSIYWFWETSASDSHWLKWEFRDAGQAQGLMNNAMVAAYSGAPSGLPVYFASIFGEQYDNKWIYLSGNGGTNPSQYNGYGMLYWFTYGVAKLQGATNVQAASKALEISSTYPSGEMWKHNDIFATE